MKKLIILVAAVAIGFGLGYTVNHNNTDNTYMDTCVYYANNPEHPQLGGSLYGEQNMWDINNPTLQDGVTYNVTIGNHGTPEDTTDDVVLDWVEVE